MDLAPEAGQGVGDLAVAALEELGQALAREQVRALEAAQAVVREAVGPVALARERAQEAALGVVWEAAAPVALAREQVWALEAAQAAVWEAAAPVVERVELVLRAKEPRASGCLLPRFFAALRWVALHYPELVASSLSPKRTCVRCSRSSRSSANRARIPTREWMLQHFNRD